MTDKELANESMRILRRSKTYRETLIATEEAITLRLGEQDAVRHELDEPLRAGAILKAHLVPDQLAKRRAELFGYARRDCAGRDAARLRVANDAGDATTGLEADLRQLGGLSRACLTADDDHGMLLDGATDFLAIGRYRQVLGIGDGRDARRARGAATKAGPPRPAPRPATDAAIFCARAASAAATSLPRNRSLFRRSRSRRRRNWSRRKQASMAELETGSGELMGGLE